MTSTNNEETVCYLCLDGDVDEAGHPLRRDCSCRGTDADFFHLSCLAKYAAAKTERARDTKEFREPWDRCPSCHQDYQNELRIDIASEFVSFVRRKYPRDTEKQVEALQAKLCGLCFMLGGLQPVQKREAGVTANVMLSLIDRMKIDASPLSMRCAQAEAYAYTAHGYIALNEGTEESAKRALTHFEKQLKVYEAIGNVDGIATAKSNIVLAKTKCKGGKNNEESFKAFKELYESYVSEYGEDSDYTICAGEKYAIELVKAFRGDEARELLTKLLATSKQVLGLHHETTKMVESTLQRAKRVVLALNLVNGIYSSKLVFAVCLVIGVLAMSYQLVKLSLSLWAVGTINYIMFIV